MLCAGQLPSLPKPFWQKALQPESLPWAIVEACPGWYERYVNSFLHSEDHTFNNTFDVGIYVMMIDQSKVFINVFINVEMKSMISVVAPSPPLHTANSLSSLQEDLDYRKWCPSVLVHTYTGHDWFRLNLNSTGKENIDRLSPNINRHVELYIYTLSLHIQYIPHQSCTYLHVYYTLSHP